jgi:hypothetical protein
VGACGNDFEGKGAPIRLPLWGWGLRYRHRPSLAVKEGSRTDIAAPVRRVDFAVMMAGSKQIGFGLSSFDQAGQHAATATHPAHELHLGRFPLA